jgi:hypothetical protein
MSLCRRLDPNQAREAIVRLGLFTTSEAFDKLFALLDNNKSGKLEWEVRRRF